MSGITFDRDETSAIVRKLQAYFAEELQQPIGQFDAEFLLDFIGRDIGAHFYNRGLHDAQATIAARLEDVQDALFQLEQPTDARP